jgi:hydrogenase expression/formation protein HypE
MFYDFHQAVFMQVQQISVCIWHALTIFTKRSYMHNTILMGHGSGGLMTDDLIRDYFVKHFSNPMLNTMADSAVSRFGDSLMAFTTDSFVVDPIFFPGGDIGKLAVCGTVNDLAVSGANPLFLSTGFILEEGFPLESLEKIVISMASEAKKAGVRIITGDTKVVKKGQCDKVFINTAGTGFIDPRHEHISSGDRITAGDVILVNGYLGDHEIAILAAREHLTFEEEVISDVASLNHMVRAVLEANVDVHFMRDITRGGLATILAEMAQQGDKGIGIVINEGSVPVREQINGVCEIYGFNPMYLANEGKLVMVVPEVQVDIALRKMKAFPEGSNAAVIGRVTGTNPGRVLMRSVTGGTRIVDKLAGEQLPRIC